MDTHLNKSQVCPVVLLEGQHPAEFSFNLNQYSCVKFLLILKALTSWFRVVLRDQDGTHLKQVNRSPVNCFFKMCTVIRGSSGI